MNDLVIFKSDYSILKSLIKINDLIPYLVKNNISNCAILDDNLFSMMEFYNACISNNIKPIIGLDVILNDKHVYLFSKDYDGYRGLLKLNTLIQERDLSVYDLKQYSKNIVLVVPYNSIELYNELDFYDTRYISYTNDYEKRQVLLVSELVIDISIALCFNQDDSKFLNYLDSINSGESLSSDNGYLNNYLRVVDGSGFVSLFDFKLPSKTLYMPKYQVEDSFSYLVALAKKGLEKRIGSLDSKYLDRLKFELNTIKEMGFVDYFLIVYDYIKFAKLNNILVGPGRGSAAGSLVSYVLGITNIDPIKYNLLFERFLNPERITMPDIDIDFEDTRRDEVISYVKNKYGSSYVAPIITYGTLTAKQVIRDVSRVMNIDLNLVEKLTRLIDAKLSLKENAKNKLIIDLVNNYSNLKSVYKNALKLEGLKRHISTHAAGIVISSCELDDVIPVYKNHDGIMTGFTMEYLEDLGLLKMDFLALRNLTIIKNVVNLINEHEGSNFNINEIPLDDISTINIFKKVDTEGIFQFESPGMKNFLRKLEANSFSDIYAAIALFRPGPMQNIDTFIERKNGGKISYYDESLKDILCDTYGIIIYQEQIMQILSKMANYTFAQADNVRRAMSKKKVSVMESERVKFIEGSLSNGYSKEKAELVYEMILKFANYGFNKAHSVSYALIGYQMAYLKSHYPMYFYANILNMNIGSEDKTKDYITLIKKNGINVIKPCVKLSSSEYIIKDKSLILPLSLIKGITSNISEVINSESSKGEFLDYLDFVKRTYLLDFRNKQYELLIKSGAMDCFNLNRASMLYNLDAAMDYASLCKDLDEDSVLKPVLSDVAEVEELLNNEIEIYGFYLSNHPASKYQDKDIVKLINAKNYFDKSIKVVVMINRFRKIKTKKNEDMGMFSASDETGSFEFVIFPKQNMFLNSLENGKMIKVFGFVTRGNYDYQIVVNKIEDGGDNVAK